MVFFYMVLYCLESRSFQLLREGRCWQMIRVSCISLSHCVGAVHQGSYPLLHLFSSCGTHFFLCMICFCRVVLLLLLWLHFILFWQHDCSP